jgi:aspartokinase
MAMPTQPVALSVEQIGELNQKLAALRHDMNNHLSLIAATVALIRHRPAVTEQMWNTLAEQPRKIGDSFSQFSRDLEAALHITRS